jgi:hypothetical protein
LIIDSVVFAARIGLSVLGERCVAMRSVPRSLLTACEVSPTFVHAANASAQISAAMRPVFSAASPPAFWPRIFSPVL